MKKIIKIPVPFRLPKIICFILLFCLFTTQTFAQMISISTQKQTLKGVIEIIKAQSNYQFFYEDHLSEIVIEDIEIDNKSIEETLKTVLKGKNISYKIEDKVIYLSSEQEPESNPDNQKTRKVTGAVYDESGEPMIGVAVLGKGTAIGTITDMEGNFTLEVPAEISQLEFSYVGYNKQTVSISNKPSINITLREDAQMIDEVVVTALGIKREKKMLGYSIQEIKSDELNKTGNASVTGALQGKIAGVQMNTSPTGLNGSTKITIRGNSSLSDNNQPLWVIDGIPFNDNSDSNVSLFGGIDRGGAAVDINPEDIESISILKGPNAAALYGSRAGNGVVLITTKKGQQQKGLGINYSGTFTWTEVAETLDMQTIYGQGVAGEYSRTTPFSYGAKLDGSAKAGWWHDEKGNFTTEETPYKYNGNKLKDYFQTGFSENHHVSISNANEDSPYRASFGFLDSKGLFEGERLKKINFDLNSEKKINKYLYLDGKVSLSKTTAENRPYIGKDGEMFQLLYLPNNISLNDLKQHTTKPEKDAEEKTYYIHDNWIGPDETIKNPYWLHDQRKNMDERWRVFGYQAVKANLTDWLTATGKVAVDYYRTKVEATDKGNGKSFQDLIIKNHLGKSEENFLEMNYEFLLLGNNKIGDKIRIDYTVGASRMHQRVEGLLVEAKNLAIDNKWYINSAGQQVEKNSTISNQILIQKRVNSVFGTFQLAYNEFISLDMSAREDWSSTLPNPYFYPSVNLSFIGSEFISRMGYDLPKWLTYGKARFSWARVGKDTEPYYTASYGKWRQTFEGPEYSPSSIHIAKRFEPEISDSFETGLEMKFFNNRLGFDFSYYHCLTKNQIMSIPRSVSTTKDKERINAGKILNEGVELAIYSIPIQTHNFTFGLDLNMSHNVSTIKELHPEKKYVDFGEDKFFFTVGGVEGGKLGDIYAKRIYKRDENNNLIINQFTGIPETVSDRTLSDERKIGNIQPKLLMSVTPYFNFKNITVSALFDMKFGGDIVSVSEAIATHYGTAKRTENRNETTVLKGVDNNGNPNTKELKYENLYKFIGNTGGDSGVAEEFVYNASYIKLRELSIGYSFPQSLLKKTPVANLRLSFVARNLGYLLKHTPGTNPEGGFDKTMYSQAFDFLATPNSRTLGFSINANF